MGKNEQGFFWSVGLSLVLSLGCHHLRLGRGRRSGSGGAIASGPARDLIGLPLVA